MNLENNYTVPFQITGVNHGLREVHGLLKLKKEALELEYEAKDSFVGMFKSGVTTFTVAFPDLQEISYDKGWFSSRIIIEGTSMKVFEPFPGAEQAVCEMKIKRKHRDEAKRLVSRARMLLSEYKLDQL